MLTVCRHLGLVLLFEGKRQRKHMVDECADLLMKGPMRGTNPFFWKRDGAGRFNVEG